MLSLDIIRDSVGRPIEAGRKEDLLKKLPSHVGWLKELIFVILRHNADFSPYEEIQHGCPGCDDESEECRDKYRRMNCWLDCYNGQMEEKQRIGRLSRTACAVAARLR